MTPFFSFVEDEATKAVVLRIFRWIREGLGMDAFLSAGHPVVTSGYGNLKKKAVKLYGASKSGINCFFVTDLDTCNSPNALGENWFGIKCLTELPLHYVFRISIREIESWIMADRVSFAEFMGVSVANIPGNTDEIADPKQFLFNLIRKKCPQKKYQDMLPLPGQHVGIAYNPMLVDFVAKRWNPVVAASCSPSLGRSLDRIEKKLRSQCV